MKKNNHKGILIRKKNFSTAMKLAVMSSLFFLLSGCLSESDTGGVYNRVNNPSGTVSGLVQDTNGNALKGATVSIAGQNKKTDAQGRYTFYKVPVSNVEGNDNDLGPVPNINVYVQPPEESDVAYLSATISVGPAQAEIDGSNVSGNNGVNTSANTITNGAITFVDGFVVEAPVAQLPALNNTVTGLLLDNTTGLPIVDKLVYLNISDTTSESVNINNDADRVTLQDVNIIANAVTNENGEFTIQKVPNDSALDLIVEGYLFESVSANSANSGDISTKVEDNVFLGNVYMTSITVGDDRSPMITEVSIHPTVDSDSLEGRTVARTIHIKLSENITTIPSISSVFVNYQDADTGQDIFLELASDPTVVENMITITTVEDMSRLNIAPGSDLKVSFARKDFADAAGNVIMEDVNDQASAWLHLTVETFTLQAIAVEAGNPFIMSVDGVIGGITDPSVAATLVLRFNKPVQATSDDLVGSAVFVTVGAEGSAGDNEFMAYSDITTSLDAAGHVLTIELNSELPQNADIRVELLQNAFLDEDDQPLTINPNANPGFDNNIAMGFVSVDFDSLQGRQATTVTLSVLTENDADNAFIPTHSALFSVSETPFGQLNNQDDDDGNGIADSAERLNALKNEINNEGNGFNVDRTLLSFALVPNAEQYELTAVNSLGVAINPIVEAEGLVGLQNITIDPSVIVVRPDGTGQDPRILLSGVTLGDTVTLMPVDVFGVKTTNGTTDTVTFVDNTPPATVLQRAYSVGNDVVAETNSFGAGAELSENVGDNANVGVPFFDIVPQVLGVVDGGVNSREITDLTLDGFYDSMDFMAWTPTRTLGVALSEDVEVVPGANLGSLIPGIPANGWNIVNDITTDDTSNVLGSADIATFTTDVMQLSQNQHQSTINFGGLLQDSSGNIMVDDNGSKLIFRDFLPPMVASSNYAVSADQMTTVLTIVFNEAIQPETFTDVLLTGALLPSFGDASFGISADNKTVTLAFAAFDAAGAVNTDDGGNPLDLTQTPNRRVLFGDDQTQEVLGNLTINNVEDRFGNSWSDYIGQIAPIPQLVVENETELLSVEIDRSEFFHDLGDTDSFNITYTFNQPVALPFLATATEGNDANTDGIDDALGLTMSNLFILTAPGFAIGDESSIVAISEENALRVNITLVEEVFGAGDEIGVNANMRFSNLLAANVFSRFDNNDSVVQDSTVANVVLRQD